MNIYDLPRFGHKKERNRDDFLEKYYCEKLHGAFAKEDTLKLEEIVRVSA